MRLSTFLALVAPVASSSVQVLDEASFGHKDGKVSSDKYSVPNWHHYGGDGWLPQLMTDKITLTPPYPGNSKGAVWTDAPVRSAQWTAELDFRVYGQEHGGGNLQVWYTKEEGKQIGAKTIHTVNKFEGLVVVVDMHGGRGGMIRGFLNDGTTDFANHHHLEELAFGHCYYNYRNRGEASKLTLLQDAYGFEVKIDGGRCFRSDTILLPSNNYFGISAMSSQTPDTFEVFKFLTMATEGSSSQPPPPPPRNEAQKPVGSQFQARNDDPYHFPDVLASTLRDQQNQFEDLHNRVQGIAHQVDTVVQEVQRTTANLQARMEELHHQLAKQQSLQGVESRMRSVEDQLNQLKVNQKDWSGHFNDIHASLKARHDTLLDVLPGSVGGVIHSGGPNIRLMLLLILGFQVTAAVSYLIYKRRQAQGPKKYL